MSEPRPVTASGHPRGRLSSWLLIAVATTAFAAGGVALIVGVWWLVVTMAGVCVACVPAGRVVGVMNDTVAWTAPLPARYRPPQGTVLGSARPRQERRGCTRGPGELARVVQRHRIGVFVQAGRG